MKKFFILSRDDKPQRMAVIKKIQSHIMANGGICSHCLIDDVPYPVPKDTECIITIGGDGTFVRAVRRGFEHKVPFIGCNLGHLGFLCELDEDNLTASLDRLLSEDVPCENRMMLEGAIMDGEPFYALNDIVLSCANDIQIVRLSVHVNGHYLYSYNCDGMIISTPTGSTGYNLSAGGPIVEPSARTILVTPINAHALTARPLVLGADDIVKIKVEPRKRGSVKETVNVKVDGAHIGCLEVGDHALIKMSENTTRVFRLSSLSFVERLSRKMKDE